MNITFFTIRIHQTINFLKHPSTVPNMGKILRSGRLWWRLRLLGRHEPRAAVTGTPVEWGWWERSGWSQLFHQRCCHFGMVWNFCSMCFKLETGVFLWSFSVWHHNLPNCWLRIPLKRGLAHACFWCCWQDRYFLGLWRAGGLANFTKMERWNGNRSNPKNVLNQLTLASTSM